jgi:hypothetical protein
LRFTPIRCWPRLRASTFSQDIPDAARWADQHHCLSDTALTEPWPPIGCPGIGRQAIAVFVGARDGGQYALDRGARRAFLAQQTEVMDAVQRMRQRAQSCHLQSNPLRRLKRTTLKSFR